MPFHAALAVSLETTSICVVDGEGTIVREGEVATDPDAIIAFLEGGGESVVRCGIERGGGQVRECRPRRAWAWTVGRRGGIPGAAPRDLAGPARPRRRCPESLRRQRATTVGHAGGAAGVAHASRQRGIAIDGDPAGTHQSGKRFL